MLDLFEQVPGAGSTLWIGEYQDGSGLMWGTVDHNTKIWTGTWVRTFSFIPCTVPATLDPHYASAGFAFPNPLYLWGTFSLQTGQISTPPPPPGTFHEFTGTFGSCGLPGIGPWSGTIVQ